MFLANRVLFCVELQDSDLPLDLTGTNFPGHYSTFELTISNNLTNVPANAIGGGVTFDQIVIGNQAALNNIDEHFLTVDQRQALFRITIFNCLALTSFPWQAWLLNSIFRCPEI